MPAYSQSPFDAVTLLQSGKPEYVFGTFSDTVAPARMLISNVALTTNVATLTVTVVEGPIPAVGSLVTVKGCPTTSGTFNVTAVAIASVSINAVTGQGTITFALTHANVVSVASSGVAIAQTPEVAEALVNGASVAVCVPISNSELNQGRSIKAVVNFPSLPTTATVTIQEAISNKNSEFSDIGTVPVQVVSGGATTTPGQLTIVGTPGMFYRLNVSGVTGGTSPTIVGKILV